MIPQQELTAEDIRQTLQAVAQEHLPFEADGYICTSEMIYDVLMKAALEGIITKLSAIIVIGFTES